MRCLMALAAVICCALAGGTAQAEKRVALVIGNAQYEHIPALPNVPSDAKAMAALFEAAKFDSVVVLHDKRAAELRRELLDFAERAAGADVAVVFYAGHGIEVDRVNYLIPVDARLKSDLAVKDETVSLDRLLELMEPARRLRVVILDACRENPFVKSMRLTAATRSVTRGLGRIEAGGANTLIAFATEPNAVAEDGSGRNSPFTAALVKHLATPGLDLRIALGNVRDEVMASTARKQKPYVTSSLGGGVISLASAEAKPAAVPTSPASGGAEMVRICREVEGMSNPATLAVLERQYQGTPAGECVAARIKQVQAVAVVAPKPDPVPPKSVSTVEIAGTWQGEVSWLGPGNAWTLQTEVTTREPTNPYEWRRYGNDRVVFMDCCGNRFDGRLRGNVMTGTTSGPSGPGTFRITR